MTAMETFCLSRFMKRELWLECLISKMTKPKLLIDLAKHQISLQNQDRPPVHLGENLLITITGSNHTTGFRHLSIEYHPDYGDVSREEVNVSAERLGEDLKRLLEGVLRRGPEMNYSADKTAGIWLTYPIEECEIEVRA